MSHSPDELQQMTDSELGKARKAAHRDILSGVNVHAFDNEAALIKYARITKEENRRRKAWLAKQERIRKAKIEFAPDGPGALEAQRRFEEHDYEGYEDYKANPYVNRERDATMAMAGMDLEGQGYYDDAKAALKHVALQHGVPALNRFLIDYAYPKNDLREAAMLKNMTESNWMSRMMYGDMYDYGYISGGNWFDEIGHDIRHASHRFGTAVQPGLHDIRHASHQFGTAVQPGLGWLDEHILGATPSIDPNSIDYNKGLHNYCYEQVTNAKNTVNTQIADANSKIDAAKKAAAASDAAWQKHLADQDDAMPAIAASAGVAGDDPGLSPYGQTLDNKEQLQQKGSGFDPHGQMVDPHHLSPYQRQKQQVCGTQNCKIFDKCTVGAANMIKDGMNQFAAKLEREAAIKNAAAAAARVQADGQNNVAAAVGMDSGRSMNDPGLSPYT